MQIAMQMSSSESWLLGLLGRAKAKHKLGFRKWARPMTVTGPNQDQGPWRPQILGPIGVPRVGQDPESCNWYQGLLCSTWPWPQHSGPEPALLHLLRGDSPEGTSWAEGDLDWHFSLELHG